MALALNPDTMPMKIQAMPYRICFGSWKRGELIHQWYSLPMEFYMGIPTRSVPLCTPTSIALVLVQKKTRSAWSGGHAGAVYPYPLTVSIPNVVAVHLRRIFKIKGVQRLWQGEVSSQTLGTNICVNLYVSPTSS